MARPSQVRATTRFNQKTYDQLTLRFQKGERDRIQDHAALTGESMAAFVLRACKEQMARDRAEGRTKAHIEED